MYNVRIGNMQDITSLSANKVEAFRAYVCLTDASVKPYLFKCSPAEQSPGDLHFLLSTRYETAQRILVVLQIQRSK